jgi:hypothetical protein
LKGGNKLKNNVIMTFDRTPTKRDPTKKITFECAEITSEGELEERLDTIADALKLVAMEIIKMNEKEDEEDPEKKSAQAAGTAIRAQA